MDATADRTDETLEALKALADEKRLEMVRLLAGRELCVCDIAREIGASDALVSHHVKRLREAGLVQTRRVGQWIHCRLSTEAIRAVAARIDALAVEAGETADGTRCLTGACDAVPATMEEASGDE